MYSHRCNARHSYCKVASVGVTWGYLYWCLFEAVLWLCFISLCGVIQRGGRIGRKEVSGE